jgi:glycosyltransferase involved in cell wall biosynthesis
MLDVKTRSEGMTGRISAPVPIAYVQSVAERGGVEVVLVNILRCLDRTLFLPTVFVLSEGPFVQELRATGTEVVVVAAPRTRNVRATREVIAALAREMQQRGVRLVHSHNAHAHVFGGLAARRISAPSILHLHGVPRPSLNHHGALALASLAVPATCTVAVSGWVQQTYERYWLGVRRARVLHNGIDTGSLQEVNDWQTVREEFGIPADAQLVLLAARLERWKGVHIFVEAAAELATKHPRARFLVVGGSLFGLDPEYAEELRRQVRALGLEKRLLLTGHRSDVYRLMRAADVVVQCSVAAEPFGLVLIEAMALCRPVVASALGGAIEIVRHGETGLLVPPGHPEAPAAAVGHLIGDPKHRERLGAAGRARVEERFTAQRMVSGLQRLYHELLDQREHADAVGTVL